MAALESSPPPVQAWPRRKHHSFRARFGYSALGFAAFVATCLCIHAVIPEPEIPGISAKLRYYNAHRDEFDTVLIGTSRIRYQISPQVLDTAATELGMPMHTFNLGVAGMHPPESFLFVERFLKMKPAKLKWVFLELEDVQASWDTERRGTRRLLYWHNWHLTSVAIRKAINRTGDRPWYSSILRLRSETVGLHLKLFAQNLANVGAVADLHDMFLPPADPEAAVPELGPARDGYEPGLEAMRGEDVKDYSAKLAQASEQNAPRFIDAYAEAEYRKLAQSIRQLGAIPVFLVPPSLEQNPICFREPPAPPGAIIAFNDVKKYSNLYDPAFRFDKGHLSREGAGIFSKLLAERFVGDVRARAIR